MIERMVGHNSQALRNVNSLCRKSEHPLLLNGQRIPLKREVRAKSRASVEFHQAHQWCGLTTIQYKMKSFHPGMEEVCFSKSFWNDSSFSCYDVQCGMVFRQRWRRSWVCEAQNPGTFSIRCIFLLLFRHCFSSTEFAEESKRHRRSPGKFRITHHLPSRNQKREGSLQFFQSSASPSGGLAGFGNVGQSVHGKAQQELQNFLVRRLLLENPAVDWPSCRVFCQCPGRRLII